VAGFLAPFVAGGVAGLLVLVGGESFTLPRFFVPYLILVPIILVAGLVLSIRSIAYVEELGDKDYAYSGLVLNLFSMFFFGLSLVCILRPPAG
jgi:hypothetical protein